MRRALFLLPVVGAIAVLLLVGVVSPGAGSENPLIPDKSVLVCGTCHSMTEELAGWQTSAHSDLSCLQCHKEEDPGWVRHEFLDRNDAMKQAGSAHTIALPVITERCEECHEPQMEYLLKDLIPTPIRESAMESVGEPLAIRALHEKHLNGQAQTTCVDCHANSAHGPSAATPEGLEAVHNRCQDCHDQQRVTMTVTGSTSCGACHVDPATVAPVDHADTAAFMGSHGTSDQDCGTCHLALRSDTANRLTNPVAFQSSSGNTCVACHQGVAMPHPDGFLAQHGEASLTAQEGTCEACHTPEQSPVRPLPDHATAQFCADCHLVPMPHPAGYLAAHGSKALQTPQVCANCHSDKNPARPAASHAREDYCTNCHDAYQHENGWVASHGDRVDESCATCHSTAGEAPTHNACSSCHDSSGTWHPAMWFVTHGKVVNADGQEACMTCHAEVEPSCSKCHRNR